MTLTGNNYYTGVTTISAGTLQFGDGVSSTGWWGNGVNGNIVDNATLIFATNPSGLWGGLQNTISGSGSLIKNGPGNLMFGDNNTYTGGTTVNSGTLSTWAGNGAFVGSLTINPGGVFEPLAGNVFGVSTGGPMISAINVNGGAIMMVSGNWESLDSNVTLTGGTIGQNPGQGGWLCPAADNPISINTLASTATSVLNVPTRLSGGNTLTFNVASGTTPGGVNLLVANQFVVERVGLCRDHKGGARLDGLCRPGDVQRHDDRFRRDVPTWRRCGQHRLHVRATSRTMPRSALRQSVRPEPISLPIDGGRRLAKSGAGILALTGPNTYGGTTTSTAASWPCPTCTTPSPDSVHDQRRQHLVAAGPYRLLPAGSRGVMNPASSAVLALVGADNEPVNLAATAASGWGGAPGGRP